jgi:hypothetical protein
MEGGGKGTEICRGFARGKSQAENRQAANFFPSHRFSLDS